MTGGRRAGVLPTAVAAVGAVLFFLSFPELGLVSGSCQDTPGGPAVSCASLVPTYLRLAGLALLGAGAAAAFWRWRQPGAQGVA